MENEIKVLIKSKTKLINELNKALDKTILRNQRTLSSAVSGSILDKLELDSEKLIIDNANNRKVLASFDGVFADFTRVSSKDIVNALLTSTVSILNLNSKYFRVLEPKTKLNPISEKVTKKVQGWLGFNDKGISTNGYLDTLISNNTVKTQLVQNINRSVFLQSGFFETKKQIGLLIDGDKANLGNFQKYYRNFTFDLYSQIDRATGQTYQQALGYEFAIYEGGLIETSRSFCRERNGKVFHLSEIEKFNPTEAKQPNYNPSVDLGGYGCRHHLNYIPTSLAVELRPDAEKFLK